MRLVIWEATIKTPAGSAILIIEASRASTALSRAGRYMEEVKKWRVPRIHQSGLSAIYGHISLYRLSPQMLADPSIKGEQIGPHVWLLGPAPESGGVD